MNEPEVVVNPNPIPASVATLLRYVLTALGTLLVTKGILPVGTDVNVIVGLVLVVVSTAYGVYKTVFNKKQLVIAAEAAPNDVAIVK